MEEREEGLYEPGENMMGEPRETVDLSSWELKDYVPTAREIP